MTAVIKVDKFSKKFDKQVAVDDLSFEVERGEIFAFLGSNGSGKTTTIRSLLDIYQPDNGTLTIFNERFSEKMNSRIGYLPEERGVYVRSGVSELFMYFLQLRGFDKKTAEEKMNEFLKRVDLYSHKDKKISQLSSGMQQKVQIGMATIHNPEILILDEPFKGLDPVNRQLFIDIFKEKRDQGATIMYSTHVIDEAQKMADSILIIHKGKSKAYGKVNEVRKSFGNDNIHLEFTGTLPKNDKLYSASITHRTAELRPQKGVDTDEILKFLLENKVKVISFKLDYPSLNDIFIKVVKNEN